MNGKDRIDVSVRSVGESCFGHLTAVWERAVRSTHDFLAEDDLAAIKAAMPRVYLPAVDLYAAFAGDVIAGFVGLSGDSVEMLFVDPCHQGCGIGSALLSFALERGATSVDVNEQNPRALQFYRKHGFRIVSRDSLDADGRPYPILHLSL